MLATLRSGSKVAIAVSCFSIYAFQEQKEQLGEIDEKRSRGIGVSNERHQTAAPQARIIR